jgi:nitrogen-specific signal transduction histidine kinase
MCDRKAVTSHEFVCTIFVMCNGNGNDNGSHITLHARFLLCAMAVASHNFVCTIFVMCNGYGVAMAMAPHNFVDFCYGVFFGSGHYAVMRFFCGFRST